MKKYFWVICFIYHSFNLLAQGGKKGFEPNFGLALSANFPTVSFSNPDLVGRTLAGFSVFYQRPISPYHTNRYFNRLDYTIEPGFMSVGSRNENTDKRFKSNYIDLNLMLNYIPDRMSEDMRLFFGVRPSYLIYNESQVIENGNYRTLSNDPENLNKQGDIDLGLIFGVNVSLGNIASVELRYVQSLTNNISPTQYLGRPSAIEVAIKLSGLSIKDKIISNEMTMVSELGKRSAGTLLVMLETPDEKLIESLRRENRDSDVAMLKELQDQTNRLVIKEFTKHFKFCDLAFFMNTDAPKVARGELTGIFVDEQLKPTSDPAIDTNNFFIASFIEDVSMYTHKPDYGLYVYDKTFMQLGKPYNESQNAMGLFAGGDPVNYFRRVKSTGYSAEEYRKIIIRFNDRLVYGKIPTN
jgi:hypothetical protein